MNFNASSACALLSLALGDDSFIVYFSGMVVSVQHEAQVNASSTDDQAAYLPFE
jgi:hypothetical protein